MDTREIVQLMRYKWARIIVEASKIPFLPKKEKLWIVTLCGSRQSRAPQSLDNRFAVAHTTHNTTATLEIERKRRKRAAY